MLFIYIQDTLIYLSIVTVIIFIQGPTPRLTQSTVYLTGYLSLNFGQRLNII
jgi:hypothetical protein